MTIDLSGHWDAARVMQFEVLGVHSLEIDMRQTTYLDAAALASLVRLIRLVWSCNGSVHVLGGRQFLAPTFLDRAVDIVD